MKRRLPIPFLATAVALACAASLAAQAPVPMTSPGVPPGNSSILRADSVAGTWSLRVPDSLQRLAGQVNLGNVAAQLSLLRDGTFRYVATGAGTRTFRGKYELQGNAFLLERLRTDDPWPESWPAIARGSIESAGTLTLENMSYERSLTEFFVGTWVLQGDPGTRFDFRKDGTFVFRSVGTRAESKGRWDVRGGVLSIVYTEVDGEKADFDMRSQATVSEAAEWILVAGRFRYVRPPG